MRQHLQVSVFVDVPLPDKGVAQEFHELFPTSDIFLLPNGRHFVQMDEAEEVARLILSAPAIQA